MRNGLALLLLGLTGLGLGTTSCGSDEATNSPSCKKAGESYQMVNSVKKGNCCTGLMSDCSKLVTTTDPETGVTLANGSCTCVAGGVPRLPPSGVPARRTRNAVRGSPASPTTALPTVGLPTASAR
jgi:hypothetical protein